MKDEEGEKAVKKGYKWEVQDCELEFQPITYLTYVQHNWSSTLSSQFIFDLEALALLRYEKH